VLRGGRVLGVLVIQNRTYREYSEEEVETLQTISMVLAELIAGGELVSPDELVQAEGTALLPSRSMACGSTRASPSAASSFTSRA
jgi:phosphotransferase system enzyme I (PtsP)